MKKVGIITFHMAFNHGAMLQAYALSKKLTLMGADVEIIDYRLPFIDRYHHKDVLKELLKKQGLIGFLKYIKRILKGNYYTTSWKKFYCFMTKKFPLSKQVFDEDFSLLQYDCYITGSDQIWNGTLTGGIQSCYFLDFVPESSKRIAYAASSGSGTFGDSNLEMICGWLNKFDAIGIREQRLADYVNDELNICAQTVLDPTLILDKDIWRELVHKVPYKNYLLIYTFDEKPYIYEKAREYAMKHDLNIITLAYVKKDIGDDIYQLLEQGPEDFVSYIYYADAVFTSSFHGTAFSIIFEKQFYCFPHPEYHERTDSLLKTAGLLERYVFEGDILADDEIDYTAVNQALKPAITSSVEFLQKNVID